MTTPFVEHDPHFRVMCCTRTNLGCTFCLRDQCSTRACSFARPVSRVDINLTIEQNGQHVVNDASPLVLVEYEKRTTEGRPNVRSLKLGVGRE